jgi:ubiquinone/menaquinone biosynthesis C-methylase UbiE
MSNLATRISNEVAHGKNILLLCDDTPAWSSPAGKIRMQRRVEFLATPVSTGKQSSVLEIGCGKGVFSTRLAPYFASLIATDISEDLVKIAQDRLGPNSKTMVCDAHRTTFDNATFDRVIGCSILHHLEWDVALKEMFRILRPGGVVRFSEPNLLNPQIFLQKNWPWLKQKLGDSPDEYAFTKWQIEESLKKAGFIDINVDPFEFLHPATPEKLIPFVVALEKIVSNTPLVHFAGSLKISAQKPNRG